MISTKIRGALTTLGVFAATATLGGVGLASFATGGEIGGVARYERDATPLGANPRALVPDSYASAEGIAPIAYRSASQCNGCGPGLAERRAAASLAAYEAEHARYEAALDRVQFAPEPEPVAYALAEATPAEATPTAEGAVFAALGSELAAAD